MIIPLLTIPPALLADDLGTQGVDFEGRPIETTATFSGGFLAEDGLIRGNVNAANPEMVTI